MTVSKSEWMSRVSFGTSIVALAVATYSCQDGTLGEEPQATTLVPSETEKPSKSAAISPDKLPVAPPAVTAKKQAEPAKPKPPTDAPAKPAPKEATAELKVRRLVATHAIENREPAAAPDLVAGAAPVFAFVELSNPADVEQEIVITFEQDPSKRVGFISLKIPAGQKRWRTWGRTSQIKAPGNWSVVVSSNGAELSRESFTVKAGTPKPPAVASTDS